MALIMVGTSAMMEIPQVVMDAALCAKLKQALFASLKPNIVLTSVPTYAEMEKSSNETLTATVTMEI